MPITDFIPIDDKILQDAGVKYVAINEPICIIGHNGTDNRPIQFDITADWYNEGVKQLEEQSRPHFSNDTITRLKQYLGTKLYFERADIVAEIIRNNAKTDDSATTRATKSKSSSSTVEYDKVVKESCERILTKYPIATIWETGHIYYYKGGKYVFGAERIIEEECFTLFQYNAKSFMVEEVNKQIKRQTYHNFSEFDADVNIINVKNGLYHIKEKILTPHTPEYLSINQKPIIYDPDAECPEFDRFESGCLYPSQIKTANQCAAATFYRGSLYEHYVIHVGRGWNGKSKFNNTMEKMHGIENVSHVAFNDISRDQYALADLEGKDLNIDNEPSGGVIKNTAILKKLSGREMIRLQQKYVKAHDAMLHAKIWFSTNDIPDLQDDSIGRFRREIVIVWPYTFKPNPNPNNPMEKLDDPCIEEKITTDTELSDIFNMLMDELHDILYKQNKRIHVDMSDIEERRKHREMLKNPVQFFVDEAIELESSNFDDIIRKDDLYKIYEKFCQLNKVLPEHQENFGKKLKAIIGKERLIDNQRESTKDPVTGKRPWIYRGIKVKSEWLDEDKREKQTSLLTRTEEEDEGEDQSSNTSQDNNTPEKKASQLSWMSQQNSDLEHSIQQNGDKISLASRSEITGDTQNISVYKNREYENARTSGTSRTPIVCTDYSSRSTENIDKVVVEIANKSLRIAQADNRDYFTFDDWLFECSVCPNIDWAEGQQEQTLHALIQEGKVTELEPVGSGRFRPEP